MSFREPSPDKNDTYKEKSPMEQNLDNIIDQIDNNIMNLLKSQKKNNDLRIQINDTEFQKEIRVRSRVHSLKRKNFQEAENVKHKLKEIKESKIKKADDSM